MEHFDEVKALRAQLEAEKAARLASERLAESQANLLMATLQLNQDAPDPKSPSTASLLFCVPVAGAPEALNFAAQQLLDKLTIDRIPAFTKLLNKHYAKLNASHDAPGQAHISGRFYTLSFAAAPAPNAFYVSMVDLTSQHKIETALQQSQNFVRNIAHTIPNIIYVYDLEEHKNTYLNEHIKTVLGYTDTELANITGKMLRTLVLPADTLKLYRHVYHMRQAADGQVLEVEYNVICKDGSVKTLFCRESVFLRNDRGQVKQIIGSAQDITELRKKGEMLLAQKNFYESILNHIPSDIAVYNNSLQYIFLNPAAVKDPALRKWLVGKTNKDYSNYRGIPYERMQVREQHLHKVMEEKSLVEFEETILGKDGNELYFLRRLNPVLNDDNGVELVIGHGLEITDLRKAQERIEASEAKNRAILAVLPDLMFIVNYEGVYLDMKNVDEERQFVPKEQIIGSNIKNLLPEDLANKLLVLVQKVIDTGQSEKTEYELPFPDGTRYYESRIIRYSENEALAIIRDNTEERKAAQEVKDKNEFIKQVVDTSPSIIFVKDAEGNFSFVNTECANLFGKPVEEIIGVNVNLFYACKEEPAFYNLVDKQVIDEGKEVRVTEKFTKENGEVVWLNTVKKPLISANGEVHVLGISTNITEQRQAQQRLEESEELFRLLSENSKDLISLHEPNGRYIYVSKACKELLGYEPEELIGRMPVEILHPDDILMVNQKGNADYLLEHKNILVQHRLIRKDGSVQWVETNIKPILGESGEVVKVQSAVRDITERKKSEEALKASEKKYRNLITYSPAFFCTHNMQGVLQEVNPHMLDRLGYTAEDMVGHNLQEFLPERHKANLQKYLQSFLDRNLVEGILTVLDKEKEERFLFYKNYKVEEPNTEPFIIGIAQDITDRMHTEQQLKKAKEAAEESARVKENFLANMSHEIRTPLNGIMGMVGLMEKSSLSPVQKNYIKIIQKSADNLLVIINDILDIAKIEAGKLELESIPFNLNDTIKAAYQTLIYKAEEKELLYYFKPAQFSDQIILGDPYRLNQVLLNLLNNAIKFTDTGSVTLSTEVLNESDENITLEFSVKDTGVGIAPEKLDYIFEGFTQAYSSTTRKYGGTGLGLNICRNLVEMQNGKIWVESEEDSGSTFRFTLTYPKYKNPDAMRLEKETIDFMSMKGTKVLLAEDNEVNVFLAKSIMENWHFKVDVAQNGLEAVRLATENTYDIILMDIQMPELSGIDAAELIRSFPDETKANVPIIALTANALKGDAEKYLSSGMNDYISKPFEEESLFLKISNMLPHKVQATEPENETQLTAIAEDVPTEPLYDLSILHKMSRGNEAFIKRTKDLFMQTVPETITDIKTKQRNHDWSGVSAAAHKLKSTIDTLRIAKLKEVIRQIESGAKANVPDTTLANKIDYLQEVMEKVLAQMKADV